MSRVVATPDSVSAARSQRSRSGVVGSIVEAGKPGITRMVTITALVGFVLSAVGYAGDAARGWGELLALAIACAVGTALSSMGANTLNEWMERDRDALMPRTAHRPLPEQRISPRIALVAGVLESIVGLAILALGANLWAALVSLACIVTYVAIYTPMKLKSPVSVLFGAIPGALPPLIGWAAAGAANGGPTLLQAGGWSLFTLMFVWQIPHFMAIAWMYRADYSLGGFRVLASEDPTGVRTARNMIGWAIVLLPATLMPVWAMPERVGFVYGAFAAASWIGFFWLTIGFGRLRTRDAARRVFFASIAHLPLLLLMLVGEALVRRFVG
ncbi:MAG: protoheme IX farnesyltransferase [Phycisphaerales bacterium]|nr:protoheme IX farnesyltransferase [Phycisphaerales bacterium]